MRISNAFTSRKNEIAQAIDAAKNGSFYEHIFWPRLRLAICLVCIAAAAFTTYGLAVEMRITGERFLELRSYQALAAETSVRFVYYAGSFVGYALYTVPLMWLFLGWHTLTYPYRP